MKNVHLQYGYVCRIIFATLFLCSIALVKDSDKGISYDALLADGAMRLKNELAIATRQCVAASDAVDAAS
jgi:uncharacterized membrane protein YciS (DUF1049 family)